ncbi:non-specific lipid transfer protein GPI-anchored 1-like [Hibiscus syriacus]|nr:non-specific lipid transfer protein GPI-anchored 1-like [Hibiscus syriacus]
MHSEFQSKNLNSKKKKKKKIMALSVIGVLFLCVAVMAADESELTTECSKDFQSVMTCLGFAQGKVATPTKECCSSVSGIKENKPKCLCYILQQTQSGAQSLKSLGVQEAKLFELPSACQLKNASVTYCPKLLGLSPNSPEAAIFTDSSSKATTKPSTPATSTGNPSSAVAKSDSKSSGTKIGSHFVSSTAALLVATAAVFFFASPA